MNPRSHPTYPDLAGKVAFVTGGSSGIGAATCRLLAANGVRVGVSGRNEATIGEIVRTIRDAQGEAISSPADCTKGDALERARELVTRELGAVDILVAFAGAGGEPKPFLGLTEENWRTV